MRASDERFRAFRKRCSHSNCASWRATNANQKTEPANSMLCCLFIVSVPSVYNSKLAERILAPGYPLPVENQVRASLPPGSEEGSQPRLADCSRLHRREAAQSESLRKLPQWRTSAPRLPSIPFRWGCVRHSSGPLLSVPRLCAKPAFSEPVHRFYGRCRTLQLTGSSWNDGRRTRVKLGHPQESRLRSWECRFRVSRACDWRLNHASKVLLHPCHTKLE